MSCERAIVLALRSTVIPTDLHNTIIEYFCIPITDGNIRDAVNMWIKNRNDAIKLYGDIRYWDTSRVTDMRSLFRSCYTFNDDISSWNVCRVTQMDGMFAYTEAFNQPLSRWNVSNVKTMVGMFRHACSFNGDLSLWDVGKVVICQICSLMLLVLTKTYQVGIQVKWSVWGLCLAAHRNLMEIFPHGIHRM